MLSLDALVGESDLLSAVEFGLSRGKGLLRGLQLFVCGDLLVGNRCLLSAVQLVLRSLKILLSCSQVLLSLDAFVGKSDLLCAVQFGLSSGKCLPRSLEGCLLRAVQRGLAFLKLLTRLLKCLVGRNVFVGQHDLSGTIFLSLSGLKGLCCSSQVCLLRAV